MQKWRTPKQRLARPEVKASDLVLELLYFSGLIALSFHLEWKPHELYLGYCIESIHLILIAALLILGRAVIEQRKPDQPLYLVVSLAFVWFPFMFSMVTTGIAKLSGLPLPDSVQLPILAFYRNYLPWLALDLLLTVRMLREIQVDSAKLFTKSFSLSIRLFPTVIVALALAALPLPLAVKTVAFHTLFAFPYVTFYRLFFAPELDETEAEAKLSLFSLGFYFLVLFGVPFYAMPISLLGVGIWFLTEGKFIGLLFAGIGILLLVVMSFVVRALYLRLRRSVG